MGRPPKKRELPAAAAAATEQPQKRTRGSYTNWFSSPYINDVLVEVKRSGFQWRRAVQRLQASAPDDRYARLNHGTLAGWFDAEHKLKAHHQASLDAGRAAMRGGRPALMSDAIEQSAKDALQRMRDAGIPVNSHVIRWTLQAVFRDEEPKLLESLKMSQQWISRAAVDQPLQLVFEGKSTRLTAGGDGSV